MDNNIVKGRFKERVETCWECECTGQLWYITPAGYRCFKCGILHSYDELLEQEDE